MVVFHVQFGKHIYNASPEEVVRLTKIAEDSGFELINFGDGSIISRDPYVNLAICAVNTSKIKLAASASPVNRIPAILANSIASINSVSNGRAALIVCRGLEAPKALGLKPPTVAQLKGAVVEIKRFLGDGPDSHDDRNNEIKWTATNIPLFVAGLGPKSLHVAGDVGDHAITSLGIDEPSIRYAKECVSKGASDAGRDPSKIDVAYQVAFCCYKEGEKAIEEAKPTIALFAHALSQAPIEKPLFRVKGREELDRAFDYGEFTMPGAKIAKYVTDEMIRKFAIAGTPDDCIGVIENAIRNGANRIHFCLNSVHDKEQVMGLFKEKILPHFRNK